MTDEELKARRFDYIDQQIEEEKNKIVKASEDKDVPKAEDAEDNGDEKKQEQQDDVYDYTQNATYEQAPADADQQAQGYTYD